ncbi:MAG: aminoacyl-tRNA hydrolase [Patescibacteria group bacterium]
MKLIVGLGNPGIKYQNTRHNVGHMVIDALKVRPLKSNQQKGPTLLKSDKFIVLKSTVFMNDSGIFVKHFISLYPNISISNLYVIHDDLDIKLGEYKIQFGKGPKENKGLVSIYETLGTRDFWHVRVGIENRQQALGTRIKGEQYVLEDFTEEEKVIVQSVIKQICNQLVI